MLSLRVIDFCKKLNYWLKFCNIRITRQDSTKLSALSPDEFMLIPTSDDPRVEGGTAGCIDMRALSLFSTTTPTGSGRYSKLSRTINCAGTYDLVNLERSLLSSCVRYLLITLPKMDTVWREGVKSSDVIMTCGPRWQQLTVSDLDYLIWIW